MTSYEFEVAAKNAVIKELKEIGEEFTINQIHLVSYCKSLQNHKCTLIDCGANLRYYEVTYNGDKEELYLDIYQKVKNKAIPLSDLQLTVIV